MRIDIIAGARPNFMKIAPIIHAIDSHNENGSQINYRLIHTGQHYDHNLSQLFFDDLSLPDSDLHLGVGSGSHAEQTGMIMIALEKELLKIKPDLVLLLFLCV